MPGATLLVASSKSSFGGRQWSDLAEEEFSGLRITSLFGGHLGRNRTLARFYWSGMSDDVKDWLGQCTICMKRKSPTGRHHPLGNIPTVHHWDRIAMDILDVCDPHRMAIITY